MIWFDFGFTLNTVSSLFIKIFTEAFSLSTIILNFFFYQVTFMIKFVKLFLRCCFPRKKYSMRSVFCFYEDEFFFPYLYTKLYLGIYDKSNAKLKFYSKICYIAFHSNKTFNILNPLNNGNWKSRVVGSILCGHISNPSSIAPKISGRFELNSHILNPGFNIFLRTFCFNILQRNI